MLQSITKNTQVSASQNRLQSGQNAINDSLLQPLSSPKSIAKANGVKDEKQIQEEREHDEERQTYGLSLLEQMSDDEYAAFERITAHMTHAEKLMSAQSLYRLTSFQEKEGANYPKEMKNGYGSTINFGGKYAKAVMWGDVSFDQKS